MITFIHSFICLSAEGYYIYHEADNVADRERTRLLSPPITSTASQICVQFRYYMYGIDNQNILEVLAKRPASEDQVFNKTGIQSPSWLLGSVTVSKPSTETVVVSGADRCRDASPSFGLQRADTSERGA